MSNPEGEEDLKDTALSPFINSDSLVKRTASQEDLKVVKGISEVNLGKIVNWTPSLKIDQQNVHLYVNTGISKIPPDPNEDFSNISIQLIPDERYVGKKHKQMLKDLQDLLKSHDTKTVAIYGQIGSGKSQMARQIARVLSVKHTFWISASSAENDYRDIADLVCLPEFQMESQELLRRGIKRWLEKCPNSWLVIRDDVPEDICLNETENVRSYFELIPEGLSHGYQILTTCHRSTAFKLATHSRSFQIPGLEKDEASDLLRIHTPESVWQSSPETLQSKASRLVDVLDKNPSAIVLAGAYITEGHLDGETIETYLEEFKPDPQLGILEASSFNSLLKNGLSRSPILAWQKTFGKINIQSQEAIDLFALMSCLDRSEIPTALLGCYIETSASLRQHLKTLSDFMLIIPLIFPSKAGGSYTMPCLVQLTAHEWLRNQGTRHQWQNKALDILLKYHEKLGEYSDSAIQAYVQQRRLLSHVDILVEYCEHSASPKYGLYEKAQALVTFAILYANEGRYGAAHKLLFFVCAPASKNDAWKVLALKTRAEMIKDTYLSEIGTERGKHQLKKARKMLAKARHISEEIKDRDVEIKVLAATGRYYSDLGRYKLAQQFQEKVVTFRSHQYAGQNNIHTEYDNAKLDLSKMYYRHSSDPKVNSISYLDKAKNLQEELLYQIEERSEQRDADWWSWLCEVWAALARTYFEQRRIDCATSMARKAYDNRVVLFGSYDLKTLKIGQDLAFCLLENREFEEAEELFEKTRNRLRDKLGPCHYEICLCEEKRRGFEMRKGQLESAQPDLKDTREE